MDETIIISGRNENVHYFSQYGYNCAQQLLTDRKPFSALFYSNDLIAIGAIKALEEFGMDVPDSGDGQHGSTNTAGAN